MGATLTSATTADAAPISKKSGIHYLDVGTSGGVWGLERGYCMMIGGDKEAVDRLDPIFKTLAPGRGSVDRTPGRDKPRRHRRRGLSALRDFRGRSLRQNGPQRNRIWASWRRSARVSTFSPARMQVSKGQADAETAPVGDDYVYDINLADVAEVWRRGSVVSSWLLDLAATAFAENPTLSNFGPVSPIPARPLDHHGGHR